jgi:hypothetical protein
MKFEIIDLSAAIENDIASDPPGALPNRRLELECALHPHRAARGRDRRHVADLGGA